MDPVNCQKAIEQIKSMLIEKESSTNILSLDHIDTINDSEQPSTSSDTFDLWSYHTSVATVQVESRTTPFYQEV